MKTKVGRLLLVLSVATCLSTHGLARQPGRPVARQESGAEGQLKAKVDDLVKKLIDIKNGSVTIAEKENQAKILLKPNRQTILFALALAVKSLRSQDTSALDEARVDKQVGGGASSSGSTSLVTKGSVPAILGFAVENGALMKSVSGTTITFRGNPVGIIKALGNQGFIKSYNDDTGLTRVLRRLSFAASFDTSRGMEPGTFLGDQQQLSAYSFRFDILNKRDPRHRSYADKWFKFVAEKGQPLNMVATQLSNYFDSSDPKADPNLVAWLKSAQDAIAAAAVGDVESTVKDQLFVKLSSVPLSKEVQSLVRSIQEDVNDYEQSRANFLELIANGTILTFEFTNMRQIDAPDLLNFKAIIEASPWSGKASLTGNASFTILSRTLTGVDRVHDFDFSGQVDAPLGSVQKIGAIVLSLSGKYQKIVENTIMPGGMMADTKGNIRIVQAKLTVPVKGSGVKIPISFTYANRTELIKEKEVRGNIGFTFDLDTIFSKLHP